MRRSFASTTLALVATLLLAGCLASVATRVQPGQDEAQVRQALGPPNARHAGPEGGSRLEYSTGPGGRFTWMVDLDAQGRVQQVQQVLNERQFTLVKDGLSRDEVLRLIGRPAHTAGMWRGGQIWSWRWPTNDCLWFQVAFAADGRAQGDGTYGPDPACDGNDRSSR
ncbi:hypothetical protein BurJ1DRAFT_2057 [Burkholderiales bacterium JOSHI_001]|nr:hypothetical protein BurJ1DRAFT_2057 [Burkholderiales bacterium JOSHI_001]